ncbi:MAG: 50S ribosomal protein L1 [Spirochaetes bacterium]|nr:50S ribosomal protein L1 [Spirochaetota bacterium]
MYKQSKRYKEATGKFDNQKKYSLDESISILKELPKAKFDETVEVSVRLGLKKNQRIRGIGILPHTFGKPKTILVFAKGEKAEEAKKAGADHVGDNDLIQKVQKGWSDFQVVIATPDMMKDVSKLGPVLGRKGLMPNPKTGTVTMDLKNAIQEVKKGKIEFRSDKEGIVGIGVAKVSMDKEKIKENIITFYQSLVKTRPADVKGEFLFTFTVSTTMGPGVKIDLNDLQN